MRTCPCCGSTTFDDMEICYGCLQPLLEEEPAISELALLRETTLEGLAGLEDLEVEEPHESLLRAPGTKVSTRFHVQVSDSLGYDIYQSKRGVTIELVEEQNRSAA
jgi:hypothetical protein